MRTPLLPTALAVALCIGGCRAGPAPMPPPADAVAPVTGGAWPAPVGTLPRIENRLALDAPRSLPGAVTAAFHPARPLLAWAEGTTLHTLELDGGEARAVAVGHRIVDLAFSPRGEVWLAAGAAERWRDGVRACRSEPWALDRLLGIDDAGITAASYTHGDGVGPLRQQFWIDNDCRLVRETIAPLPPGVRSAGDDPGDAPGRATLRPAHALPDILGGRVDGDRVRLGDGTTLTLPGPVLAVSPDGRWWVIEQDGQASIWRLRTAD